MSTGKIVSLLVGVPLALFVLIAANGNGGHYEESAEVRIDRECSNKFPTWKDANGNRVMAQSDAMQFHVCVGMGLIRDIEETKRKRAATNAAVEPKKKSRPTKGPSGKSPDGNEAIRPATELVSRPLRRQAAQWSAP